MARFRQRILDEGKVRFFGVHDAQFDLVKDLATQRTEYGLNFAQLAGVAAGDDELFHERILPRPRRLAAAASGPAKDQAAKNSLNAAIVRSTCAGETSRWSTMRMCGVTRASMPLRLSPASSKEHTSAGRSA